MSQPATRIADLSDPQAIRILALVLDYDRPLPDPSWLADLDTRLREAATDPDPDSALADLTDFTSLTASAPVTSGALARATLAYLLDTRPALVPVLDRALALSVDDTSRFDPATLAIGGLVLLALQTEVELTRSERGRWRFRFHKQPMRDSAFGQLLGKLLTHILPSRS